MPQFSGLKINKWKCEVAGIGIMKGVNVALCGLECVKIIWRKLSSLESNTFISDWDALG